MTLDALSPREFRDRLKDIRGTASEQWDASRHLVGSSTLPDTLTRLRQTIEQTLSPSSLRETLLETIPAGASCAQDIADVPLKELTGLPTTKAIRALCVFFGLLDQEGRAAGGLARLDDAGLTQLVSGGSPFDRLLDVEAPSVLDLGTGDLSFVEALADQYLPRVQAKGRRLLVHALDRVDAQSSLGAAYQAPPERLRRLQATPGLEFRYWSQFDMFALAGANRPRAFLHRYELVTCWAPANPTFAYEPTRLSPLVIRQDLERTRGGFRQVAVQRERALEVRHRGRELLFPSWKFDVRGPLALLDLLTRTGSVAVLGAVDATVFWELLAQLVADPRPRTPDVIFTDETRPRLFGDLYPRLSAVPIGGRVSLAELATLRQDIPRVLPSPSRGRATMAFRYVGIRRGATFPDCPSSLTARRFEQMSEEPPPWFLVLVS